LKRLRREPEIADAWLVQTLETNLPRIERVV
jgi:hypothetical protein